jgi:hypothetical protein
VYSASHIGRNHLRVGRNNQDGHFASSSVVVVTDGCSSQPNSEVGAQLGARFLGEWLEGQSTVDAETPKRAMNALCTWMLESAKALGGDLRTTLERYFLFTVLAAVRQHDSLSLRERGEGWGEGPDAAREPLTRRFAPPSPRVAGRGVTLVVGMGDGGLLVDDAVIRLDSGPDNAPNYCAYRLFDRPSEPELHFFGEDARVALMTDGLNSLDPVRLRALVNPEGLSRNPLTLQRRLNVLAETERFTDDATLAVLS